jgi:hypothetical protein
MEFSFQETSAAAAAVRALQQQLRELREQNSKLQNELSESSYASFSSRESYDKKFELLKNEFFGKESSMKQDIIYLCERVKTLEQENLMLISENNSLKQDVIENKQNQRMIIMLQEELQILTKKLVQKETEHDLLNKRICQLEEQSMRNSKHFESFINVEKSARMEKNWTESAEHIDSELSQQKYMYREYLKNPNPSSQEWKSKVDQLRKSIEINSQELLKLRKDQHDHLRSQLEND